MPYSAGEMRRARTTVVASAEHLGDDPRHAHPARAGERRGLQALAVELAAVIVWRRRLERCLRRGHGAGRTSGGWMSSIVTRGISGNAGSTHGDGHSTAVAAQVTQTTCRGGEHLRTPGRFPLPGRSTSPAHSCGDSRLSLHAMAQPSSNPVRARPALDARDVICVLYSRSWEAAVVEGVSFSEARLAAALPDHPRVGRVLLVNPYRSLVAKAWRSLRPRYPDPPARERVHVHEPFRLRRTDPVSARGTDPALRGEHAAGGPTVLGSSGHAVITANPLLAGFGAFDWAGPVTFYAWDDWTSDYNRPHLVPAFEESFAEIRAKRRRVCAVTEAVLERIGPTGSARRHPERHRAGRMARTRRAAGVVRQAAATAASLRRQPREPRRRAADRRSRDAYPDGSVVLVGPLQDEEHFAPVMQHPNVVFAGVAPRRDVVRLSARPTHVSSRMSAIG